MLFTMSKQKLLLYVIYTFTVVIFSVNIVIYYVVIYCQYCHLLCHNLKLLTIWQNLRLLYKYCCLSCQRKTFAVLHCQ